MLLFNTLTRREEVFAPSKDNTVRMYACGLTVYARGHIGNFRTFVCLDILRRTLRYVAGFKVRQVINFTDVDDKTIKAAREANVSLREYTDRFIAAFREDVEMLGIESVEDYPRATDEENILAMVETIKKLEKRGYAYRSDGSIYFKITAFEEYGKLVRLDHDGIKAGARVDSDQYAKQNARDFVLWKATSEHEPTWEFGIGPGRPGWHIECSAMALRLLDEPPIDIHAGGVDLIFPHHENEIAQSEGATGRQFARFWIHVEHLLIDDNDKMSKSSGKVLSVQDVLDQGYRASALRYVLLSTHYRKQLRFTWDSLVQADEALTRLMDFLARLEAVTAAGSHSAVGASLIEAQRSFNEMMCRDLNTPGALGVVFELVRTVNAAIDNGTVGTEDAQEIRNVFADFDQVLGVISLRRLEDAEPPVQISEIEQLIEKRQEARRRRDFSTADSVRDDLEKRGIILEDSTSGTRWKRK